MRPEIGCPILVACFLFPQKQKRKANTGLRQPHLFVLLASSSWFCWVIARCTFYLLVGTLHWSPPSCSLETKRPACLVTFGGAAGVFGVVLCWVCWCVTALLYWWVGMLVCYEVCRRWVSSCFCGHALCCHLLCCVGVAVCRKSCVVGAIAVHLLC